MILTAITFLVILTVLVLIHELGHFTIAKLIGVKVEEFGMGLPPRIWGKKIGETIYSINWLPIGGFVRLAGEDQDFSIQKDSVKRTAKQFFWARSKKERSAILIAGVFMNFALAVAITAGLLVTGVKEPSGSVHIEKVMQGSPAEAAGLQAGDVINSIMSSQRDEYISRGHVEMTPKMVIEYVSSNAGTEININVARGQEIIEVTLVPRINPPPGEGAMGVAISDLELRKYSLAEAPGKSLVINLTRARDMLNSLGETVWKLLTLQKLTADVAGPIGIAQVTGQAVKFGWQAVFEFASILSLNLAVLNILPIPALDGGRLLFVFIEKAIGRKVRPAFEKSTHQIGMIILLALIFLVSINDILRLVRGG